MKKLTAVILSLVFLFSAFSVSAQTELPIIYDEVTLYYNTQAIAESEVATASEVDFAAVEAYIAQQCRIMSDEIVLASYNINEQQLNDIFSTVINDYPELFFVSNIYGFKRYSNGQIYSLLPQYNMTKEERSKASKEYERMVDILVSSVPKNFNDLQKVLYVHDIIDMEAEYDNSLSNFDVYTMLTQHAGVCQAYTLLFEAVVQKLGIECHNAVSDNQNHTWNVVKIDGEYYHVDLTWDDTMYVDMVSHEYFLLSSDTLIAKAEAYDGEGNLLPRSDWRIPGKTGIECTSNKYESGNYVWSGVKTPILAADNALYTLKVERVYGDPYSVATIERISDDLKTTQTVVTLPECAWWANDEQTSYWPGYYSGFYSVGDTFYGNTTDSIWYCKIKDGITEFGYAVTYEDEFEGDIYNSAIDGKGHIKLYVGPDPNNVTNAYADHLPFLTSTDHNAAQAILNMRKHILGSCHDLYNSALFDVNGDLQVNVRDLVHIKRCIAGQL